MRFERFDDRYIVRLESGEPMIDTLTDFKHLYLEAIAHGLAIGTHNILSTQHAYHACRR